MTTEILSRLQMAFTLSYHIIFPSLTIGLACYIAIMEGMWLKTKNDIFKQQALYWLKPFAITFGMGVVTGVVLSYEFGANFSGFSAIAGPVIGPLMAYEVMTAFFLEAGFLGIMLFGRDRVNEKIYFGACTTVAVGTLLSSFWIIAANSWMQTPAGTEFIDGQFRVISWYEVIFNPSFGYRLVHMLLASFITTGFVIAGVSAAILLRHSQHPLAAMGLRHALIGLLVLLPSQIVAGDLHGLNVLQHQPVKVAAMEGIWENEQGAAFRVLAWPDKSIAGNRWSLEIPNLTSLILTHDPQGQVKGLKNVPSDQWPNVILVFYSFRVMVGLGSLMLLTVLYGGYRWYRGHLSTGRRWLKWLKWMTPTGFIATLAGWYVAEVGRQPWVVYNKVLTSEVYSPLNPESVYLTLTLFIFCYGGLSFAYVHFMKKTLRNGAALVMANTEENNHG